MSRYIYALSLLILSCTAYSKTHFIPLSDCKSVLSIPHNTHQAYRLTQNIDCQGYTLEKPITFSGHIDGQGFSISHLSIRSNQNNVGLFSLLNQAHIHDLKLSQIHVEFETSSHQGAQRGHFIGLLAGSSYLSQLEHIEISHSHIEKQAHAEKQVGIDVVAPVVALFYASSAKSISSIDNLIATNSNNVHAGGLFAEIYESPNLADFTVESFKLQLDQDISTTETNSLTLGGIAARIESSQVEAITLSHTKLNTYHRQGQQGLLFGHADSALIQDASIRHTQLESSEAEQGVIGYMSCYDAIASECALKQITIDDLHGLDWFQHSEWIQVQKLIELFH